MKYSFLIFAKPKPGLDKSVAWLKPYAKKLRVVSGERMEPFPEEWLRWSGDFLVSYISPWVIPGPLLARAKIAAINFHPGPPEYPGIGCTNFALYNQESVFGVTCHYMVKKVDTGPIIMARRFPVAQEDSVWSLTQNCYEHITHLFQDVFRYFFQHGEFPKADETWRRQPYRRRELDALCRVKPEMIVEEIRRRVRATYYPAMPGPYVELAGCRFVYAPNGDNLKNVAVKKHLVKQF